jgi:hypothetical protein
MVDNLDTQTGRTLDAYSYILQELETGEELRISFRHRDLVPAEANQ